MEQAYFIVREGWTASALFTCCGPFASEDAAKDVAATLQPGSYRIFGPAPAGASFAVAAPAVTFSQE